MFNWLLNKLLDFSQSSTPDELNVLDGLFFAGLYVPHKIAETHFCFVGASGSGKTVSIRLLLKTSLPFINNANGNYSLSHRALIYDAKQDIVPILEQMRLDNEIECEIKNLNPFSSDSYAWDMAEDIKERSHALELASILIPLEANSQQPFFTNSARNLIEGVITSFMLNYLEGNARKWTFRDVVYAMESKERIIEVLNNHDETRELIPLYFSHVETSNNIMSTIATKIHPYKVVAGLWENARLANRTVSLKEWLNKSKDFILVLGNDETAREAIDSLNRVVFKRLSQLILAEEDIEKKDRLSAREESLDDMPLRRHWLILDEISNAGKLDGLDQLLMKGRSKGASIVLGFQDIEGLQAVYGEKEANALVGQCSNYGIFRLQSPETAEWASRLLGGKGEVKEVYTDKNQAVQFGTSHKPGFFFDEQLNYQESNTGSTTERVAYREVTAVYPADFLYLTPPDRENGLQGFYFSPYLKTKAFGIEIPSNLLFERWLKDSGRKPIKAPRRQPEEQKLEAWTEDERPQLGLTTRIENNESVKSSRRKTIEHLKANSLEVETIAKEFAEIVYYREEDLTAEEKQYLFQFPKAEKIFERILKQLKKQNDEAEDTPKKDAENNDPVSSRFSFTRNE